MIRLMDAAMLATTKLRTRKPRTGVTVVMVSMLFSILVLAVLLVGGVTDSAKRFMSGNLSERYIVNVQYFGKDFEVYNTPPPEVQARANELYIKLVADKKAEAKRLGIEYNPDIEPKPVGTNGQGTTYLEQSSPAASQALREYIAAQPSKQDKIKQIASPYHPKRLYPLKSSTINGQMKLMKDGKEDLEAPDPRTTGSSAPDIDKGWQYLDGSITESFLFDKKYLDAQKNTSDIPVIAPYSKIETALGLKKLPNTATPKERLERINYIREHGASATLTVCYRNEASQAQIGEAINVAKQINQNKNNKDYQKPSLIYGLPPADSCGPALVTSDTRTAAEKKLAEKQKQFDALFGKVVDPVQKKVNFRVVGLSPDGFSAESFSSVGLLVSAVAGSSLQGSWVVPQDLYDTLPTQAKVEYAALAGAATALDYTAIPDGLLVEFSNAADIKAFMSKEGCTGPDCGEKPYLAYFGSNSVLIQDINSGAASVLSITGVIIAVIAALIMMGMIGRVINDSRRETAVFRAIGAKRNDIRAIYSTYTLLLSLCVVIVTLLLGFAAALWIDSRWSIDATVQAQLTFTGADSSMQFRLIGLWWQPLLVIAGLIILTGFVSLLLPLSRNLVRSPIKDMRDDT